MSPSQSLAWLVRNDWTLAQIAGVARVATSAVRVWLKWNTAIPQTPGIRLMIAAFTHERLLASLESPAAPDDEPVTCAITPARYRRKLGAPRVRSFADLVARHCR